MKHLTTGNREFSSDSAAESDVGLSNAGLKRLFGVHCFDPQSRWAIGL